MLVMAWCVIVGHGAVCVASTVGRVQDKGGETAAMRAAINGHLHCLTALVDHKADLDIQVRGRKRAGQTCVCVCGLIDR